MSGPSAGLAFTLTIIDKLSPGDLTGGKNVAVTGTIELDGTVGDVGGVPQKTAAAIDAGAKLFLVPSSEVREAKARAGSAMKVVGVDTIDDALRALRQQRWRPGRAGGAEGGRVAPDRPGAAPFRTVRIAYPWNRDAASIRWREMTDVHRRATSSSRLSPEEIINRGFASAFRGVSETEVRNFLRRVADEITAMRVRETELNGQIQELQERLANPPPVTEQQLLEALGEETARVLRSAQDAAEDMRKRAEERAAARMAEAKEAAERIRQEAEQQAATRTEIAERRAAELEQEAEKQATLQRETAEREATELRETTVRETDTIRETGRTGRGNRGGEPRTRRVTRS